MVPGDREPDELAERRDGQAQVLCLDARVRSGVRPDERAEQLAYLDAPEQALPAQERRYAQERSRRLARVPFGVAANSRNVAAQHSLAADSLPDAACPKARRAETASTSSQRERLRVAQAARSSQGGRPLRRRWCAWELAMRL